MLKISELYGVTVNEILSGRRLSEQEYKAAAEENLNQLVKTNSFNRKDKLEYFKKKWLKEHTAIIAIISICIIIVLAVGIIIKNRLLTAITPLLIAAAYGWLYNSMMSYVEEHVYGDAENG